MEELWLSQLGGGKPEAAWDLFLARYRRLILATITRVVDVPDDVMDVFSRVCQVLSADGFARLRRFTAQHSSGASFATWLVVVVRNLSLDWLRERDGRRRLSVPPGLSPLQQLIYQAIWIEGCSHVEAYEQVGSRLSFPEFLRAVRETYRLAPRAPGAVSRRPIPAAVLELPAPSESDPVETAESARRVRALLGSLPAELRLAVELFVVEQLPAAQVARMVGWPNAKAVYNKVHRALTGLRGNLEREGIGPGDL